MYYRKFNNDREGTADEIEKWMKSGAGNMDLVKSPGGYFSELITNTSASTRRVLSAVFQYPINPKGEDTVDINVNPSKLGDFKLNETNNYNTSHVTELTSTKLNRSVSSKLTVNLGSGYSSGEKAETI